MNLWPSLTRSGAYVCIAIGVLSLSRTTGAGSGAPAALAMLVGLGMLGFVRTSVGMTGDRAGLVVLLGALSGLGSLAIGLFGFLLLLQQESGSEVLVGGLASMIGFSNLAFIWARTRPLRAPPGGIQ